MSVTSATVNRTRLAVSNPTLALLCACFVLSGVAALVYQTAWTRQFAIVFGTSELAVATVLAAYMGGLALGALLAERFLPRVTRPVLTYALLEIGIAVTAIFAVPMLLRLADAALQAMFGGQPSPPSSDEAGTTLFYLISAFVALALPTTLMGATLPMLARYAVSEESQIGRRIGMLYAMNTAGAVIGALLTAFVLLPDFGLTGAVYVGAAMNIAVFLLAWALAQRTPSMAPPTGYAVDAPTVVAPRAPRYSLRQFPGPAWVLPLMLLAGGVAFYQEVLWARMLAHVVGSSIYAFGVMVASFLTGIALGGGAGAALAKDRERAAIWLGGALILAAVAAGAAYLLLETLLPKDAGLMGGDRISLLSLSVPLNTLFSGLLLLPMTFAIGMTYPLAVRVLAHGADDAAPASARVYSWNTVGAIVGSLAAGFVLIPALRYEGAIRVAVYASAALGVLALWLLVPVKRTIAIAVSLLACAVLLFMPEKPEKLLVTSPLNVGAGRILHYDVGRSASVVLLAQDGGFALRTNGLPEALMDTPGMPPRFSGEYWLSPLAVIARPNARDMLIVGFGGGVVVEGVPPTVANIDVIELEPEVITANRQVSTQRRRDPLGDPRVNVILNDARGALRLTSRRYDAIVSQPSHPWTAGASHLYTREFMELARDHLTTDGVFVQWMNVIFMDEAVLRSLTATLLSVFPEVRVYHPDPNTVVFLASAAPLNLETQVARTGMPLRATPLHYARFGINNAEDLVAALVLDTDGARRLSAGSPLITDDDNRIATSSVFERGRGMNADTSGRVFAPFDPLQRPDSFVFGALRDTLDFPYIVRRNSVFTLLDPSLVDRVGRLSNILGDTPEGIHARASYYRMRRQDQRARELLRIGIEEHPASDILRMEFLRDWFGMLARGRTEPEITEVATALGEPGKTVLRAAQLAARGEWQQVAALDDELATVPWTNLWYGETVEMRANWRSRVTGATVKRRYGDEAVQMIDRLAIMNSSLGVFVLRARAGLTAERPDVAMESVSNYARMAVSMAKSRGVPAENLRGDAGALREILGNAEKLPGADAVRAAEVRTEIDRLSPAAAK